MFFKVQLQSEQPLCLGPGVSQSVSQYRLLRLLTRTRTSQRPTASLISSLISQGAKLESCMVTSSSRYVPPFDRHCEHLYRHLRPGRGLVLVIVNWKLIGNLNLIWGGYKNTVPYLFCYRFDLSILDVHLRPDIPRHGQQRGHVFADSLHVLRHLNLSLVVHAPFDGQGRPCFSNFVSLQGSLRANR